MTFEGSGYAIEQTIPSGKILDGETNDIIVQLKRPDEKVQKQTIKKVDDADDIEIPLD